MKNKDYTLVVRDVPSEHQKRISNLLSALQDNIAVQGFGTVYKSEYSPEPEEWIVEVELGSMNPVWAPSHNYYTNGSFNTQASAEAAIVKNEQHGDTLGMNYRVVRTKPTRLVIEPKPAEEWIVEILGLLGSWQRSGNLMTKGIFASEEAAEKAIIKKLDKHKNSLKASDYRTRRVTPEAEAWIVEFQISTGWTQSTNGITGKTFASKEEAEKAIVQLNVPRSMHYRTQRIY